MTGEGLLAVVSLAVAFEGDLESETLVPPPEGYRIPSVAVSGVRLLPAGRVGAVIVWGPERSFRVYEQVDGNWRIADEIRIYD